MTEMTFLVWLIFGSSLGRGDKVLEIPLVHVLLLFGRWRPIAVVGGRLLAIAKLEMVVLGWVGLFTIWGRHGLLRCVLMEHPVLSEICPSPGLQDGALDFGRWRALV